MMSGEDYEGLREYRKQTNATQRDATRATITRLNLGSIVKWVNSGTVKVGKFTYYTSKRKARLPDGTYKSCGSFYRFWEKYGEEIQASMPQP